MSSHFTEVPNTALKAQHGQALAFLPGPPETLSPSQHTGVPHPDLQQHAELLLGWRPSNTGTASSPLAMRLFILVWPSPPATSNGLSDVLACASSHDLKQFAIYTYFCDTLFADCLPTSLGLHKVLRRQSPVCSANLIPFSSRVSAWLHSPAPL